MTTFETEAWYIWGNMKVLLGHLDWELGTKGPHSDPADKIFWDNVSKWSNFLLKMGKIFCHWLLHYHLNFEHFEKKKSALSAVA